MIIYPAIDLRDGKCVRLYQGDYQQETVYADTPKAMIKTFIKEGATWLHLIDLDAARDVENNQEKLISTLLKQENISIQIGGGIRSIDKIKKYFDNGAARIIIGSLAVQEPDKVITLFKQFGADRLVLALDVTYDKTNKPFVATNAWQTISYQNPSSLITTYQAVGIKHILCTDIRRDGTLQGPNMALYDSLLKRFPFLHIQASGGIHCLADLMQLREIGCRGAIIGRALYENKFTLNKALLC